MFWFLVLSAAAWMILRLFFWPGHKLTLWGTVEAFAHIWVGFVLGVIVLGGEELFRPAVVSLVVPSIAELVMAVLYIRGIYTR